MTTIPAIRSLSDGSYGVSVGSSPLTRSAPEPRSPLGSWAQTAGSILNTGLTTLPDLGSALGGTGIADLLNKQIQVQQVMQSVSMYSNLLRSQHETEMAPIRNMRVG